MYAGPAARVVTALKFANRRSVARPLGVLLARRVRAGGGTFDLVTWAPTSAEHRRRRGFDQAEAVARVVARELGIPCRALLRRVGSTPQTGRSRRDRIADGPGFVARPLPPGIRVLVVDDVVTTGSTLRAAATALRDVGAEPRAYGVVRTPGASGVTARTGV